MTEQQLDLIDFRYPADLISHRRKRRQKPAEFREKVRAMLELHKPPNREKTNHER